MPAGAYLHSVLKLRFNDYSKQKATAQFTGPVLDSANVEATIGLAAALIQAIVDITEPGYYGYALYISDETTTASAAEQEAQREIKWGLEYQGDALGDTPQLASLPMAKLSLLSADGVHIDKTQAVWTDLVAAWADIVVTDSTNNTDLLDATYVSISS